MIEKKEGSEFCSFDLRDPESSSLLVGLDGEVNLLLWNGYVLSLSNSQKKPYHKAFSLGYGL